MADSSTESEGDDVIRLSLRKPKAWKWSLTTSVSSPGVVVPVIQLWDSEQGSILVDTGSNPKAVKKRSKTVSFERHVSKQSDKCLSRSKSDNAKRVSWGENRPLQQSDEPVKRRDNDETERHIVYRSLEKKDERKEEPSRSLSLSSKDSWNVRFAKPNDYVVPRIPVSVARKVSLTTTTSLAIPEEASGSNIKARPSSGIPRFTKSNVDATTTRKDKDTLQNDKLPHRNNIIVLRNDILPGRNKATALNDRKAKNNESVVPSGCSVKQNKPNDSNGPRFLKQDNVSDINVSKASCSSGLKKPSPVRRPCQEKVVKITPTKRAESSPEKVNNTPTKRVESSPEKLNNTLKKRAESSPEKVNNTPTKRAESSPEKVNNTPTKRAQSSPKKVNNTLTKRAESSPEKVNKPGVINKQRKVEMELCFSGPNRHTFDVRRTRSANDKALGKQSSQQNRESSAEKTASKIPTSSQLGKPKVTRYPVNRNVDCPSDQRKPNTCVSPIKGCNSNKNNNINKCSNKKIETAQQDSKPDLVVNKSRIPSLCGGLKPTNSGKDVRDNAAKRDSIRARRLRAECRHRIEKQYCSSSSDTETNQTHMDCQRRKRRSLNIKVLLPPTTAVTWTPRYWNQITETSPEKQYKKKKKLC